MRMGGLGIGVLTNQMAAVAGMCSAAAALQRLRVEWGHQQGGQWLVAAIDDELSEPVNGEHDAAGCASLCGESAAPWVVSGAASVVAAGPGRGGGAGSGAAAGEQGVRTAGGGRGGEAGAAGGQRSERQGRQGSGVSAGGGSHEQRPGDIAGACPQADKLGK